MTENINKLLKYDIFRLDFLYSPSWLCQVEITEEPYILCKRLDLQGQHNVSVFNDRMVTKVNLCKTCRDQVSQCECWIKKYQN